jgi:hypothetical protein
MNELDLIYDIIDKKMYAGDLAGIDFILSSCICEKTSTDILLGLLTATLPVKTKLLDRQEFLNKTIVVLKTRKEYTETLLSDLS